MGSLLQTIAALLLLAVPVVEARADASAPPPALEQARLDIRGDSRLHSFTVEIAESDATRARGLMFRESMAVDAGMLFIYPRTQITSFWMKNTLIPLDMLFIRDDGEIVQIAADAVPGSLKSIRSTQPVRAVLEINGGLAAALGIEIGDRVTLYRRPPKS